MRAGRELRAGGKAGLSTKRTIDLLVAKSSTSIGAPSVPKTGGPAVTRVALRLVAAGGQLVDTNHELLRRWLMSSLYMAMGAPQPKLVSARARSSLRRSVPRDRKSYQRRKTGPDPSVPPWSRVSELPPPLILARLGP